MSAMEMPRKQRGGSAWASFSRIPEKSTSAKPKPIAAANEKKTDSKNPVPCLQLLSASSYRTVGGDERQEDAESGV